MKKGDQRRQDILDYITSYRADHGFAPSVDEIAGKLGMVKSNVHHHLLKMERVGLLTHDQGKARSWRPVVVD